MLFSIAVRFADWSINRLRSRKTKHEKSPFYVLENLLDPSRTTVLLSEELFPIAINKCRLTTVGALKKDMYKLSACVICYPSVNRSSRCYVLEKGQMVRCLQLGMQL